MFERTHCFQLVRPLLLGLRLMIAVAFVTSMGEARGAILADARGDFGPQTSDGDPGILPATGTGEWRYLASDTVNPTLDPSGLDLLPWETLYTRYRKNTAGGAATQVDTTNPSLALDELGMCPSGYYSPRFVVVRWIAGPGEAGLINIAGNVRKVPGQVGGNGVTFDIYIDGVSLFSRTVGGYDTVGYAFDETATVGLASTVDYVVGPNTHDWYDSTALKATIQLVQPIPEPSALVVWGLGIVVGLGAYHWRRKRK